jgi:hypothetical protein
MGGSRGNSSSKSETRTSSTTQQTDSRVGATDGGIAIGAGANVSLTDQFPAEAVQVFNKLIELTDTSIQSARDAGGVAIDAVSGNLAPQSGGVNMKTLLILVAGAALLIYVMRK